MNPASGGPIDHARPVRPGEEPNVARLADYLRERIPALHGELTIQQFPAGFSNLTYLMRAGATEVVLRRPPIGAKIKTAHDMGREYRILSHLYPVYNKVPRPILFCEDESVLGVPFYVMERVRGVILRARPPAGLEFPTKLMRRLSQSFVQTQVELHAFDYEAAGLRDLGQPAGYVSRQIEGWTRRYYNARTDEVREIEQLAAWLSENQPPGAARAALIHNDYKYDNIVLDPSEPSRVIAVLDWEMATIGDPLMDLGTTLGYWVDTDDPEEWQRHGFGLTALDGSFSRTELLECYERQSGRAVAYPVFFYAYGLMKIAVIVQQIFYRYHQGITTDARFAGLGELVKACGNLAQRAIEKGRINNLG